MANSHVQGLSLRTQVHVMNIGRSREGSNRAKRSVIWIADTAARCSV